MGLRHQAFSLAKKELIHWSMLNMSPQEDRIGRPCKVGKETIFALLKALESFVNQDYDGDIEDVRCSRHRSLRMQ